MPLTPPVLNIRHVPRRGEDDSLFLEDVEAYLRELDKFLHQAFRAQFADVQSAEGRLTSAEGRLTSAEGRLTSLEQTVSTHNHDDRYYTESEADSRFVNASGDTMSGSLTVGGTIVATARYGHRLGDSADTVRALSILNSALGAGSVYFLTLGKANSANNQGEIGYHHAGDGSAFNELWLGLYGNPDILRIRADQNVFVRGEVEFVVNGWGIILRSPNGTRYKVTVNDAGDLVTTRV